jgi:glucose-1-phosphate thymidylyltransferase
VLLKQVEDARRFGVATIEGERITRIDEKPAHPATDLAVTGCYMYDNRVFEIAAGLEPSARGELEITDVNNWYLRQADLGYEMLRGWWTDAGTFEALHRAGNLVAKTGANKIDTPRTTTRRKR